MSGPNDLTPDNSPPGSRSSARLGASGARGAGARRLRPGSGKAKTTDDFELIPHRPSPRFLSEDAGGTSDDEGPSAVGRMVTLVVGALGQVSATFAGGATNAERTEGGASSSSSGDSSRFQMAVINGDGSRADDNDNDDYRGGGYDRGDDSGRTSVNSTTSQSSGASQSTLENDHEYGTDGEGGRRTEDEDCDTEDEESYRQYQEQLQKKKKQQKRNPTKKMPTSSAGGAGAPRPTLRLTVPTVPKVRTSSLPNPLREAPRPTLRSTMPMSMLSPEANVILPALNLRQWLLWAERLPLGVGAQVWVWHPQMPVRPVFARFESPDLHPGSESGAHSPASPLF
jgi:hypothetical protein